ncbi:MAG TPA: ATP-binding protein [Haliangium sp.]|nr:ATP-binding protein [Haliangium sp.]
MQLTVRQKINLGGVISAMTILLIVIGALSGRTTLVDTLQETEARSEMTGALNQLQLITHELINHEVEHLLTQNRANYDRWSATLQRLLGVVEVVDDFLHTPRLGTPQMQSALEDFVLAHFEYKKSFLKIHGLISKASDEGGVLDIDTIRELHGSSLRKTRVAAGIMIGSAGEMVALNHQMLARDSRDTIDAIDRIYFIITLLAIFGILAAVAVRFFAIQTISQPLALLTAASQKMVKGEFDLELNIQSNDELGELARALQEMANDLRSLYATLEQKMSELASVNANLARSNADLEQFAYVASHDLQEPLRTISGLANALARRYQGKLDAKADRHIHLMTDGAARMSHLIQGLLTYSRAGANDIPFREVDCGALVAEVLVALDASIHEAGAQIIVDSLPTIVGERTQLAQLFQNLLGNALKFKGSEPVRVRIAAEQKEGAWQFSVEDNGIGMEPQATGRLFTLFQRLHTKEEYPGTGLGLAICKKIVERHGGRIWVDSQAGRGSIFHWTIPIHSREETRAG